MAGCGADTHCPSVSRRDQRGGLAGRGAIAGQICTRTFRVSIRIRIPRNCLARRQRRREEPAGGLSIVPVRTHEIGPGAAKVKRRGELRRKLGLARGGGNEGPGESAWGESAPSHSVIAVPSTSGSYASGASPSCGAASGPRHAPAPLRRSAYATRQAR